MDKIPDKPNSIRLDVYELKNYKPVLNYRINVSDKIILSVDNSDIPPRGATKCVNEPIKEYLEITPLTPIENLDYGSQLTHRFQIKKLGWKNLFLNLTDNDLIKLGFRDKPKSLFKRTVEYIPKIYRTILGLLGGIGLILAIMTDGFGLLDRKKENQLKKTDTIQTKRLERIGHNKDSLDSINILRNDSLTKKLK